ncbi:MAG: MBL fold metallo-hydrolase [Acidobacteria bacterium]|nr:MBL fold metallo-hydrolase [Acidobacteriota bacterium]
MVTRRTFLQTALQAAALSPSADPDTRVVLLGTGNPNPDPNRMGPALAILSGDAAYLVDCGPGVVRRAAQAGIGMDRLTRAFITHLHSDHTAGYPDLIFTPAVTGRLEPLLVYGPPGLKAMTAHVLKAWRQDIDVRLHGLEPAVPRAYQVLARDVKPGGIYRDSRLRVTAFAANHGNWKHSYGYRFDAPGKSIVVSGDTTFSESLIRAAQGCDILVHEVYSVKGWERRTPDWRRYHAAFHTSGPDLGRLAARVQPKKLVLYHQLPMGESPEQVTSEIRRHFSGPIVYGKDLDVIR